MWSLGFEIKTSSSCQQRQHKTCRRILSACYFHVTRRWQERRKGILLWSLSGLQMHSAIYTFSSALHCAWFGRSLLCYLFPYLFPSCSKATLQPLLRGTPKGCRCTEPSSLCTWTEEGKQTERGCSDMCSYCVDWGRWRVMGPKSIWGKGKAFIRQAGDM